MSGAGGINGSSSEKKPSPAGAGDGKSLFPDGILLQAGIGIQFHQWYGEDLRFTGLVAGRITGDLVDIHYISKVDRTMAILLNEQVISTPTFLATGNWCFEGGVTRVQTIEVEFLQGSNSLVFRATGSDAPFIDKIVLRAVDALQEPVVITGQATGPSSVILEREQAGLDAIRLFPNPVREGSPLTLMLPASIVSTGSLQLQITELSGRVLFSKTLSQGSSGQVALGNKLRSGVYILTVRQGMKLTTKKIVVQ